MDEEIETQLIDNASDVCVMQPGNEQRCVLFFVSLHKSDQMNPILFNLDLLKETRKQHIADQNVGQPNFSDDLEVDIGVLECIEQPNQIPKFDQVIAVLNVKQKVETLTLAL